MLEGYKVAKEMALHGAGASTFSDWWGYKIEAEDAIPGNAGLMTHKKVNVSINSDSAEHARRLNTEAAKSVRWGRHHRRSGARDGDDEPSRAAAHRQTGWLNRGRQGRGPRRVFIIPLQRRSSSGRIDGIVYYDRVRDLQRAANVESEKSLLLGRQGGTPAAAPEASEAPAATGTPRPSVTPTFACR